MFLLCCLTWLWTASMSQSRIHFARRWSQGLLFHQAIVDCARAAILMPLGTSILHCRPVNKCSLVETAFLLLVTVSTVNLLTTVLNDAPVLPDDDDDDAIPMLMDSPQCVIFGMFMIWWVAIQDQNLFYQLHSSSFLHLNAKSQVLQVAQVVCWVPCSILYT